MRPYFPALQTTVAVATLVLILPGCKDRQSAATSAVMDEGSGSYSIQSVQGAQGDAIKIYRGEQDLGTVNCTTPIYGQSGKGVSCSSPSYEFSMNPNVTETNMLLVKASNTEVFFTCDGDGQGGFHCDQKALGNPLAVDPNMPKMRLMKALTGVISMQFIDRIDGATIVDSGKCTKTQGVDSTFTVCDGANGLYSFNRNVGLAGTYSHIVNHQNNNGEDVCVCQPSTQSLGDTVVLETCLAKAP